MQRHVPELEICLTAVEVLAGQGIDPDGASQRLAAAADLAADEARSLLRPVSLFTTVSVSGQEEQRVWFEGGWFEGPLVARAMAGADELAIAICSIGEVLEHRVDELMHSNPLLALALDGAGIAALRRLTAAISDLICERACQRGCSLGMRVQPGQEGWPLEQQHQVFSLLPARTIGVRLTEHCLMIPRRSVSFVIPVGERLGAGFCPCDLCSKRDRCGWRRPGGPRGIS